MADILLKRVMSKDLNEVLDMERSVNSKTYAGRVSEKEVADFINNEVVYFIERSNATIGMVSYKIEAPGHVRVDGLIVKPEFRNKGLAKEAMKMVLEELKDKKRIDLTVHPHNNPAILLYLSLGFIIESWKDNYYGEGEPRLILVYQNKLQ